MAVQGKGVWGGGCDQVCQTSHSQNPSAKPAPRNQGTLEIKFILNIIFIPYHSKLGANVINKLPSNLWRLSDPNICPSCPK